LLAVGDGHLHGFSDNIVQIPLEVRLQRASRDGAKSDVGSGEKSLSRYRSFGDYDFELSRGDDIAGLLLSLCRMRVGGECLRESEETVQYYQREQ
jgi:hypothetical protein